MTTPSLVSDIDRPTCQANPQAAVAIIGGGFSGAMTALHLRRTLAPGRTILLIECAGEFARGLAYTDTGAPHLLNVRAANMSAFPDDPGHFERWVAGQGARAEAELHRTSSGLFASRRLYGDYLQETLSAAAARSGGTVRLVRDEVETLTRDGDAWVLGLKSGQQVTASGVVLACGNLPMNRPNEGVVYHNPWAAEVLQGLRPDAALLIVGTGLTMVDLVLALHARGFHGPLTALSRRGLLSLAHEPIPQPWPTPEFTPQQRATALGLLRAVRAEVAKAATQAVGWRAVIDSLRPITAPLWRGLPTVERARFYRHARPYWDIHRHRMAPTAAATLAELQENGQLTYQRGRITAIAPAPEGALVSIAPPNGLPTTRAVQRVIYATGLQGVRTGSGLLAALLAEGSARLDAQELGLDVDERLAVLDRLGQPVPGLWALGPLVRGVFWECLAVPDIRVQARALAEAIARALVAGAIPR